VTVEGAQRDFAGYAATLDNVLAPGNLIAILRSVAVLGILAVGMAVVAISPYRPEIRKLSDRILVFRQGRVFEEFAPHEASEEKIMYAAVH